MPSSLESMNYIIQKYMQVLELGIFGMVCIVLQSGLPFAT